MKRAFNTYIAVILILLLGTFSHSKAKNLNNKIPQTSIGLNNDAQELYESFVSDLSNTKADLNPIQDKSNPHYAFDLVDSEEVENEESSSHQTDYNKELSTAFINAKVFDDFSRELQKNVQRVPGNIKTPKTRIHLLHQVFII